MSFSHHIPSSQQHTHTMSRTSTPLTLSDTYVAIMDRYLVHAPADEDKKTPAGVVLLALMHGLVSYLTNSPQTYQEQWKKRSDFDAEKINVLELFEQTTLAKCDGVRIRKGPTQCNTCARCRKPICACSPCRSARKSAKRNHPNGVVKPHSPIVCGCVGKSPTGQQRSKASGIEGVTFKAVLFEDPMFVPFLERFLITFARKSSYGLVKTRQHAADVLQTTRTGAGKKPGCKSRGAKALTSSRLNTSKRAWFGISTLPDPPVPMARPISRLVSRPSHYDYTTSHAFQQALAVYGNKTTTHVKLLERWHEHCNDNVLATEFDYNNAVVCNPPFAEIYRTQLAGRRQDALDAQQALWFAQTT